ncbi:MAG: hypothetical protein AAGB00_07345 [Planctomycetota bacterium]
MCAAVWKWVSASREDRVTIEREGELNSVVEHYLSRVPGMSKNPASSEYWCDLVESLLIEQYDRGRYKIAGNGYSPAMGTSPTTNYVFEIEMKFAKKRARTPSAVDVRIGHRGPNSELVPSSCFGRRNQRPKSDDDWAVVVEVL